MPHLLFPCTLAVLLIASPIVLADEDTELASRGASRIPGEDPLGQVGLDTDEIQRPTIRYKQGQRFTLISSLMPIMNFNPQDLAPKQEYATYFTQEFDPLRGIAPVSAGIQVTPDFPAPPSPHAEFTDEFEVKARLINNYAEANNATMSSLGTIITNADNRLILLGLTSDSDDHELSNGDLLKGTAGQRETWAVAFGRRFGDSTLNYSLLNNSADNVGTPASTFDFDYVDVEAHIFNYSLDRKEMNINLEVRRNNLDRGFQNWKDRPWYPDQTSANIFYDPTANIGFGPGNYLNAHYGPQPNTGLTGIIPVHPSIGSPVLLNDNATQIHIGELNSLAQVKQGVDSWDWRFDISVPFQDGSWRSGIDGYTRSIILKPTKPYDDPRFAFSEVGNSNVALNTALSAPALASCADPGITACTAPGNGGMAPVDDWALFQVRNEIDDDAIGLFTELDIPIDDRTNLYLGARWNRFEQDNILALDERGVEGRFLYEQLGLRYILEEVHGVTYSTGGILFGAHGDGEVVNPNNLDHDQHDDYFNLIARIERRLSERTTVSASLASYHEQPSAFERTFPAPLDPASNTIDGRTYMGNLDLDDEHHKRLEFGISHTDKQRFYGALSVYYDRVDDYIQGVPVIETTNDTRELEAYYELGCGSVQYMLEGWNSLPPDFTPGTSVSPSEPAAIPRPVDGYAPLTHYADPFSGLPLDFDCIGDNNPLRFDNIDAELYGFDATWGYRIKPNLLVSGVIAYQRGERRDTGYIDPNKDGGRVAVKGDDLYRILPPYTSVTMTYLRGPMTAKLEGNFYGEQDDVSRTNGEQETSGYGLVNAVVSLRLHPALQLDVGVNNLFDKAYTDHLTAVSRRFNQSSDPRYVNYQDRIAGLHRNAFVRLTLGIKWPLPKK